jgi:hypothetical protein
MRAVTVRTALVSSWWRKGMIVVAVPRRSRGTEIAGT